MGKGSHTSSIEKKASYNLQLGKIALLDFYEDTGYPHDGRADKDSYPQDSRADKDSYPHDRRADKYRLLYEPRYEKTGFLQMQKQRRRSAVR